MINLSKPYFIFFTLGDWGGYKLRDQITMRAIGNQMHNFAKLHTPKYIVALGDNFYDKGVESSTDDAWNSVWLNNYINEYPLMQTIPWYAILGNHDYYGGYKSVKAEIDRTKFCRNWYMPKNQYTYYDTISKTYSIFLDTCQIYPELYTETYEMMNCRKSVFDSLNYLEGKLIEAQSLGSKWILVFGHYHLFSNGYYNNYDIMISRVLPLLSKYKVDAYFCGHEHNFQLLSLNQQDHSIYFIVNGAGTYTSHVVSNNMDTSIETHYVSEHNGFTRHFVQDNMFHIQFIDLNGVCKYHYTIMK